MADQKITQLTELTTVASEDLLAVVDDPSGTPMTKKATISNLVGGLKATGAEVDTGTEDAKIVTPKAIADSKLSYTDGAETLSNKTLTAPQINDTTADHQYIFGVSELTADRTVTLPLLTGNDEFVFKDHTQTLTNKTLTSPLFNGTVDGWISANETWTYVSADDPTFTFKIAGVDLTTKYSAGMRIKLTQTTVKYFIITTVAFSTDTTITVYGGTDYDLANEAITSPYYSTQKAPQGFPLSPTKWTVELSDTSSREQASPTATTWYNIGSLSISVPIGKWYLEYVVTTDATSTASQTQIDQDVTASTANNSESNTGFTTKNYVAGASGTLRALRTASLRVFLEMTSKTTYYLNSKTGSTAASIKYRGDIAATIIRAVSAYL